MKTKLFKIAAILLLLAGSFYSCEKSGDVENQKDFYWEIPINSSKPVIDRRVDGIEYVFCLLNEKGVPATRFNQGENFSFYFAVINHRKRELYMNGFDLGCNIEGGDLGRVISSNQDTISDPFMRGICTTAINPQPFYGRENKREMNVPWDNFLQRRSWYDEQNQLVTESFQLPPLPAGEFYTVFLPIIRFMSFDKTPGINYYVVGPINFKINFKIENNHEENSIF